MRSQKDPNNDLIRSAGGEAAGNRGAAANGNPAAQKYEFEEEGDEAPEMDPPLSEDESAMGVDGADGGDSEGDNFFADANEGYPDGFV